MKDGLKGDTTIAMDSALAVSIAALGVVSLLKIAKENAILDEVIYRLSGAGRLSPAFQRSRTKIKQEFEEVSGKYKWWPLPIRSKR